MFDLTSGNDLYKIEKSQKTSKIQKLGFFEFFGRIFSFKPLDGHIFRISSSSRRV